MDVIKNILINYWQPILAAVIFILSFIVQLIKKKPVNDILSYIFDLAIKAINIVEDDAKKDFLLRGDEKLARATSYVLSWLGSQFPTLNTDEYIIIVERVIEKLLSTPQKKGGSADGEKKTNG